MWRDPSSAIHRSLHGTPRAEWSTDTELLAGIHDQLAVANKQRSGKRGRIKPLPRPKDKAAKKVTIGKPMNLDDLDALLGWESPRSRE